MADEPARLTDEQIDYWLARCAPDDVGLYDEISPEQKAELYAALTELREWRDTAVDLIAELAVLVARGGE